MLAVNGWRNSDVIWIQPCPSMICPKFAPKSASSCTSKVLVLFKVCLSLASAIDLSYFPLASQFHDIENHFPHLYLTTNKQSIPISLVHIFVSIARHLGVSASPVEFPGRVLAHVPSPPGFDDFLVDVYGADTQPIVSLRDDIPIRLMRLGIPPNNLLQYVSPCGASPMLLRAARNILSSFRMLPMAQIAQSALYAAVCIHLLLTNEIPLVAHMLSHVDLDPLHCSTFLADLQPLLRGGGQQLLETSCRNSLELEEQEAVRVHPRTTQIQITHYVGMVFKHRSHNYVGCIVGWDVRPFTRTR